MNKKTNKKNGYDYSRSPFRTLSAKEQEQLKEKEQELFSKGKGALREWLLPIYTITEAEADATRASSTFKKMVWAGQDIGSCARRAWMTQERELGFRPFAVIESGKEALGAGFSFESFLKHAFKAAPWRAVVQKTLWLAFVSLKEEALQKTLQSPERWEKWLITVKKIYATSIFHVPWDGIIKRERWAEEIFESILEARGGAVRLQKLPEEKDMLWRIDWTLTDAQGGILGGISGKGESWEKQKNSSYKSQHWLAGEENEVQGRAIFKAQTGAEARVIVLRDKSGAYGERQMRADFENFLNDLEKEQAYLRDSEFFGG